MGVAGIRSRWRELLWRWRPPVLVLGGGGARGFAHIGVLQAIEARGLPVRAIVGTSMGAGIGSMILALGSVDAVVARWREALEQDLVPAPRAVRRLPEGHEHPLLQVARRIRNRVVVSMAVNRSAMLDDKELTKAFDFLIPDLRVEDLPKPFIAVATDLETGEAVALTSGPLRSVVRASSSIPGILPPVELDGRLLVDGGVVAEVPVALARPLGGAVVAVDVSMDLPPLTDGHLVLDTMMRTQTMTSGRLRRFQLRGVRQIIRPDVGHATWADWSGFEELVVRGREAAERWFSGTA